jgi:hypothetical protein
MGNNNQENAQYNKMPSFEEINNRAEETMINMHNKFSSLMNMTIQDEMERVKRKNERRELVNKMQDMIIEKTEMRHKQEN